MKKTMHFLFISCIIILYRLARQLLNKGYKMKITFNEYTMQKAALFSNGLQVIEQYGRFLLCKEYKGQYKVFLNTSSFDYAIQCGQKM